MKCRGKLARRQRSRNGGDEAFLNTEKRFREHSRGKQESGRLALLRHKNWNKLHTCVRIMSQKQIYYSDKYDDEKYEYRHVMLPKDIAKRVPKTHLMSETEWRNLGVQQSQGWVHYMIHQPEPHILLFRRLLSIQK
uniref:Cyclin-dependent kinases regulatory subunit n=1 Tax=Knipowitschia caucasica TaxID=637954 RepID=A0AAV2KAE2_KNICA